MHSKWSKLFIIALFLLVAPYVIAQQDEPSGLSDCVTLHTVNLSREENTVAALLNQHDIHRNAIPLTLSKTTTGELNNNTLTYAIQTADHSALGIELTTTSPEIYLSLIDFSGQAAEPLSSDYRSGSLVQVFLVHANTTYALNVEGEGIFTVTVTPQNSKPDANLKSGDIIEANISEPDVHLYNLAKSGAGYLTISITGDASDVFPQLLDPCFHSLPLQLSQQENQTLIQVYQASNAALLVIRGNGAYQLEIAYRDNLRIDRGNLQTSVTVEGRFADTSSGSARYTFFPQESAFTIELTGQRDEIILHNTAGIPIIPDDTFYNAETGKTNFIYEDVPLHSSFSITVLADFYYELTVHNGIRETPQSEGIVCAVRPFGAVNQRSGPGLEHETITVLTGAENYPVIAQSVDSEGYIWWQLQDETWVRSDVINLSGDCAEIPLINS